MNPMYTASATVTKGGRTGHVASSDGVLDLNLAMPKELGGSGGEGTNPEQLFAAGYASCFDSALNLVARQSKIRVKETKVTADVSIGKDTDGGFKLSVSLEISIPELDHETTKKLAEQAHHVCPYSKATRGNIDVSIKVV
ncbi:organic hydroperoxide resistance protein [Risungbinella massiliensis]|uniref:organic hydroperoxide resistance protein n=1 Tax=Risungbinella massiliensis TaxID=1329796 RepID=UPI0005CBB3F7|nr:organic hydroperoxide resistance protein [Risungbinella massiliensis]